MRVEDTLTHTISICGQSKFRIYSIIFIKMGSHIIYMTYIYKQLSGMQSGLAET